MRSRLLPGLFNLHLLHIRLLSYLLSHWLSHCYLLHLDRSLDLDWFFHLGLLWLSNHWLLFNNCASLCTGQNFRPVLPFLLLFLFLFFFLFLLFLSFHDFSGGWGSVCDYILRDWLSNDGLIFSEQWFSLLIYGWPPLFGDGEDVEEEEDEDNSTKNDDDNDDDAFLAVVIGLCDDGGIEDKVAEIVVGLYSDVLGLVALCQLEGQVVRDRCAYQSMRCII